MKSGRKIVGLSLSLMQDFSRRFGGNTSQSLAYFLVSFEIVSGGRGVGQEKCNLQGQSHSLPCTWIVFNF